MDRVAWESLPPAVHDAIQEEIGVVVKTEPISEGQRTAVVVTVHTKQGRAFVKGAPTPSRASSQLEREAAIAPFVTAIAPELVCEVATDGWRLLAFEYIEGRQADYSPGSPDLPRTLETLTILDQLPCPDSASLMWFERRWSGYLSRPRTQLWDLTGNALLHTDLNPTNLRVGPSRATLVDWAAASRGPRFVNPADLVVCLIACGHAPQDAEAVVADLDAWRNADPESINIYARTLAATWLDLFWSYTHPWSKAAVDAAQQWATHRWEST